MKRLNLKYANSTNSIILITLVLISLNLIGLENKLLFHFLAETITIVICGSLFTVVWLLRRRIDNGYFIILAIGLLFSAAFDLMHILTFEGISIFPGMDLDHSLYFFLSGRLLQSITFLVAPICVSRKPKNNLVLLLFLIFSASIIYATVNFQLPPLSMPGGNHSAIRNLFDALIVVIFIIALGLIYRKRKDFNTVIFWIIFGSTTLALISEVIIALNTNEAHLISVLGLNVKLIAYFLIFQSIMITGISQPQEIFYHGLQTSWEQLQNLIDNLNEGICVLDHSGQFIYANPAASQIIGGKSSGLIGINIFDLILDKENRTAIEDSIKLGKSFSHSFELEINDLDQQAHSLMIFASPRLIEGKSEGQFLAFHDISQIKADQAKLEEARKLYQTLFMDAPIRIWELDYSVVKEEVTQIQNTGIVDLKVYFNEHPEEIRRLADLVVIKNYNRLAEKTYRPLNSTEPIKYLSEIFWERSYQYFTRELIAIASGDSAINFEMTTITPNGDIRYSLINWSAIIGGEKDYTHVIVSADDITEREISRRELQKSEEKFRLLAENSEVGIGYFDLEGKILYHNEKLVEQMNRQGDNFIGENLLDLVDNAFSRDIINRLQEASQSDQSSTHIYNPTIGGKSKWFSVTFTRIIDQQGQCSGIQMILHNITQQREMEMELESLARFPRENPNSVMRLSNDGVVTYSNEGGYPILKIWNYEEKGHVPDYIKANIIDSLKNKEPKIIEEKVNGQIFSLYMAPIPEMGYVNIYGRDITALKEAEEKLVEYSKDLEITVKTKSAELLNAQEKLARQEKLAVMGQLASGVGHELRNPLAVINNAVYMLRLGVEETETSKEYLGIIDQEVASANRIITDLLTFARIKPANIVATHVQTSLEEIFRKFVPPENVQLTIDLPEDLPVVYIDDKQIEQVIANIVTNAYQAIPEKGQLVINGKPEKDMLRLDFTDTGIGIPAQNIEKIFEPLFSTKTKGIGLGLTISKMLAEANGGKIKVKSTIGKGTTFSLYLPLNPTDE